MLTDMTGLGDQHIMICLRSFAVGIAVNPVTVWQITLESFGVCHFFLICWKYLIQFRAGTWRIATVGFYEKRNTGTCRQKLLLWREWGTFYKDKEGENVTEHAQPSMPWPAPLPTASAHSTYQVRCSLPLVGSMGSISLRHSWVFLAQAVRQPWLGTCWLLYRASSLLPVTDQICL